MYTRLCALQGLAKACSTIESSQEGYTETNWSTLFLVSNSKACLSTELCTQEYSRSAMGGCCRTLLTFFKALEGPGFVVKGLGFFLFLEKSGRAEATGIAPVGWW